MASPALVLAALLGITAPCQAVSTNAVEVPVEGQLGFASALQVSGGFSLDDEWVARWTREPGEPAVDLSQFLTAGSRVHAAYRERAHLEGVPSDRGLLLFDSRDLHLADFSVKAEGLETRQFAAATGAGRVQTTDGSRGNWSLTTAAPRVDSDPRAFGMDLMQHSLMEGEWRVVMEGPGSNVAPLQFRVLYFYGFSVTIEHRDGVEHFTTGARASKISTLPGAPSMLKESFLMLIVDEAVGMAAPPQRGLHLEARKALVTGTFDSEDATGRLSTPHGDVAWDDEPAHFEGSLLFGATEPLDEERHATTVRGTAQVLVPASTRGAFEIPGGAATLWTGAALGLLALVALLLKPLWSLFSRVRPDAVLDEPERARIHEAIQANPGIHVGALTTMGPTTGNNVRYHLSVLQRHGRIRAFRHEGVWRYVTPDQDPLRVRQRLALENDPKLRTVVERVGADGAPASEVAQSLRTSLGLSRSGSWNLIQRAVAAQLVAKERLGASLRLRPLASPSRPTAPSAEEPTLPRT